MSTPRGATLLVPVALAALAAFGPRGAGADGPPSRPGAPPNVVLIISDDHGWTDYGFMGHPHVRTPNLDRLATQSLVFRQGRVPSSLCCPSLASIITGRFPHEHRVTSNDPPLPPGMRPAEFPRSAAFAEGRERMNRHLEAVPTLPRLLAAKGYRSLQTGKWWQGDFRRGGFTHGMTRGQRHGDEGLDIGRKTMQPIYDFIAESRRAKAPFFVWYAPMLPHQPHNPPERLLARYRDKTPSPHVAKYWAMVEWFDETCGQLLDHLDREGLADNTLVLYVADNGWVQDPNRAAYTRSKQSPYDAGLRSPILVRWPGRVEPRTTDAPAMSVDLAPTVLAAAGLTPPTGMSGFNLLDRTIRGRGSSYGACFTHNAVDLDNPAKNVRWRWVVRGNWKLIVPGRGEAEAPATTALFDLSADPDEAHDLAAKHPEVVARLRRELDDWWNPDGRSP